MGKTSGPSHGSSAQTTNRQMLGRVFGRIASAAPWASYSVCPLGVCQVSSAAYQSLSANRAASAGRLSAWSRRRVFGDGDLKTGDRRLAERAKTRFVTYTGEVACALPAVGRSYLTGLGIQICCKDVPLVDRAARLEEDLMKRSSPLNPLLRAANGDAVLASTRTRPAARDESDLTIGGEEEDAVRQVVLYQCGRRNYYVSMVVSVARLRHGRCVSNG
ncbi:hypothetical protein N658DRAFT_190263 [Parathielavia hyrcaniae]|uniref:Uncharacterized protein n=1 Tax=Parathielavia hyrcaniae TaxID=113614 RepID=A0AAN6T5H6_9PEZI|nr:hypothetical protein N658DRAFT_190263 [Parathielavia hyrcaniae]